jgi:hypothetical protein
VADLLVRLTTGETLTFSSAEWTDVEESGDGTLLVTRFDQDGGAEWSERYQERGFSNLVGKFRPESWDWWRTSLSTEIPVSASDTARVLGLDPESRRYIVACEGRYGPFVGDGITNASCVSPSAITLERARELLEERRGNDSR